MQKQKKQLIIIIIGLVAVIAVWAIATWLPPLFEAAEPAETTEQEIAPVINIAPGDVSLIEIFNRSGTLVLVPETVIAQTSTEDSGQSPELVSEELVWTVKGESSVQYDIKRLTSFAAELLHLQALREIETDSADSGRYGIDQNSASVVITENNGEMHEIVFGDELASGSGTYATLKNSGRICSVSTATAVESSEDALYWLDRSEPVEIEYNDLTHFEMTRSRDNLELDVECRYTGDPQDPDKKALSFQITSPIQKEGETSRLGKLVEQLTYMQAEEYVEIDPVDLSVYGLDQPGYRFSLKTKNENVDINIGSYADSDSFFVMTSSTNAVMKVSAADLASIDSPLLELADPFVSLYSISRVEKISADIRGIEFDAEISVKDGVTASDESTRFLLDGRDAKIFSQNNENLFVNLFQSITGITIEGIDLKAEPENINEAQLIFHLKAEPETGEPERIETVEFVRRDDYTDYVFIDGRYTGFYIDSEAAFSSDIDEGKGIVTAYHKMVYAIENAVDGIFNTEEGYK